MDFLSFKQEIRCRKSIEFTKGEWLMPMFDKDILLKILNTESRGILTMKKIKELY